MNLQLPKVSGDFLTEELVACLNLNVWRSPLKEKRKKRPSSFLEKKNGRKLFFFTWPIIKPLSGIKKGKQSPHLC